MSCPMHPTGGYGCRWCDADARRDKAKERKYTAADLMRVAEAVREACAEAVEPRAVTVVRSAAEMVRAVDVAEVVRRVTK